MKQDTRFLHRAYYRTLMPIMLSVLGGTVNALIDSVLVSQLVGPDAMAAVNVSMPIYLLLCTVGALIAGGASALATQAIGENDLKKAAEHYHVACWLCMVTGIVITIVGVLLCGPLATLLSNGAAFRDYVYKYALVTFFGASASMALYIPGNFLQLDGKTKSITVMFILIIVTDLALDLLLMLVFPFGIIGAAAASVLSMIAGCIFGFYALHHGYSNFPRGIKIPRNLLSLLKFGSPAALGNLFDALRLLAINAVILAFYQEQAAVWAAINTICELTLIIVNGIPRAGFPLIGAFFISHENNSIRIIVRLEVILGVVMSAATTALLVLLNEPIGFMFSLSEPMLIPCLCTGVSTLLYVLSSIWENFFHATARIKISNIISISRRLVFPFMTALALAFQHWTLWLFLPLSGLLAIGIGILSTAFPYYKNIRKVRYLTRVLLLDNYLEREQKVLDFSIPPDMNEVCTAAEQLQIFCVKNNMNQKQAMRMELSIEELLNVIIKRIKDLNSVDLRAYAIDGCAGLRIRYAGRPYNPFTDTEDEDFGMGVALLAKMADITEHSYTLGMNIVNIIFPLERKE